MKQKIKSFFKIPLLLMLGSLLFVQCEDTDTAPTLDSLDATLAKSADLSVFKAAIAQAKLDIYTKGPGPFTLLAPTDAAFNAVGITAATLPSIDSITLTAIVLNHFQNISRTSFEFPDGPNAPMASIGGFSNYSFNNKSAGKIYVSGASVIQKDIRTSNGIVHKIDRVLLPPALSVVAVLGANPNYSLMVQAINKATLNTAAGYAPATTSPITVFALSNAVMTANGYDATTIAALTGTPLTTLTTILRYHIVAGRNFSTDMKAGNLKTIQGSNVAVTLNNGVFVKGISNASPFQITPTDIAASNGVIHAISGMLKP